MRNGEKQPRKQRGQGASAANEQPLSHQLPKELKRQRSSRAQPSRDTPRPLARPRPSGRGGSLPGHNTRCTLRPPPLKPAHLKGGKKKRRKSQAAKLPKEFPRGEKSSAQGEQSLKGEISSFLYTNVSS